MTTPELHGAGFSDAAIRRHVVRGWLTPLFRGVYLVGRSAPTAEERDRAALKAGGTGAVLAFRSAGAEQRLVTWSGPVELITATHRRRQRGLHPRCLPLAPQDVTTRNGLPITTVARTLCDLAMVLTPDEFTRAVHEAEVRKQLRVAAVDAVLARTGPRRGSRALRRALERHRPVDGTLNSTLEQRFHRFLADRGYPPSEHNVGFELEDGEQVTVDVLFRAAWLAVEVDGGPHRTPRAFHADRRRDRRLEALYGLPVIRVTDDDLDAPAELDADLRAALRRRAARNDR